MPGERTRQFLNLTTDELKSALVENAYLKDMKAAGGSVGLNLLLML